LSNVVMKLAAMEESLAKARKSLSYPVGRE
jgi:hypothetical protein